MDKWGQRRLVNVSKPLDSEPVESVASLVDAAMTEKNLSSRDVEALTDRHGHRVSYSAVAKIRKGQLASPKRETLGALAVALSIPTRLLEQAADLKELGTPFLLPDYARRLSGPEREAIRNLIRVMAESKDDTTKEDPNESEPQESREDYGLAAHSRKPGDPDPDQAPDY